MYLQNTAWAQTLQSTAYNTRARIHVAQIHALACLLHRAQHARHAHVQCSIDTRLQGTASARASTEHNRRAPVQHSRETCPPTKHSIDTRTRLAQ